MLTHQLAARRTLSVRKAVGLAAPLLLLSLVPLLVPTAANATAATTSPSPASGTEAITITSTIATTSDGNTILYQLATQTFTGTFTGTAVGEDVVVIHPDGTFNVRVVETFTGTVLGSTSGTATVHKLCAGTVGTSFTCLFVMGHGTGGLDGVHARGTSSETITGKNTIAGTYTGLAWFSRDDTDTSSSTNSAQATSPSSSASDSPDGTRQASGTATVTVTASTKPVHDGNGNTIIYFLFTDAFTGTISGTAIGEGVLVIHPDGTVNVAAIATFTGTILGKTGTTALHIVASGTSTSTTGSIELNHGTGELRGVEVEGPSTVTATSANTFSGTYTGRVEFDSDS